MLNSETHQVQSSLAKYCRTGRLTQIDGARSERLPEYRRLVYNVVTGFLDQAFPIAQEHLSKEEWEQLCNDFFEQHACQPSEAWRIPQELVHFVERTAHPLKNKFTFLPELLYFEWLEIEVYNMMDKPDLSLGNGAFLNPHFVIEQFSYPVHQKLNLVTPKGEHFLLLFRHPEALNVRFMELSALSAFLIETMSTSSSIESTLEEVAKALNVTEIETLRQQVDSFLNLLREKGMVY